MHWATCFDKVNILSKVLLTFKLNHSFWHESRDLYKVKHWRTALWDPSDFELVPSWTGKKYFVNNEKNICHFKQYNSDLLRNAVISMRKKFSGGGGPSDFVFQEGSRAYFRGLYYMNLISLNFPEGVLDTPPRPLLDQRMISSFRISRAWLNTHLSQWNTWSLDYDDDLYSWRYMSLTLKDGSLRQRLIITKSPRYSLCQY